MGITHFEEAQQETAEIGHLHSVWTYLGDEAGSERVGVNRIQVADEGWATPAHEHAAEEEIFYVLGGRGICWHDGRVAQIGAGDCMVFLGGEGAHTVCGVDRLDVLAFGMRVSSESTRFPRLGIAHVGRFAVDTMPESADGIPLQWLRESKLGPPEISAPEPASRPSNIVHFSEVEAVTVTRARVVRTRRRLSAAAGSVRTGLQHVEVAPGKESTAQHCHSMEEEMFVVLAGDGVLVLDAEEVPVRPGSVVSRPAATGVSHMFRAGESGLSYLAYGTREPGDVCYYPRSNKIAFRGVGVIARLERLEYWDGED